MANAPKAITGVSLSNSRRVMLLKLRPSVRKVMASLFDTTAFGTDEIHEL